MLNLEPQLHTLRVSQVPMMLCTLHSQSAGLHQVLLGLLCHMEMILTIRKQCLSWKKILRGKVFPKK